MTLEFILTNILMIAFGAIIVIFLRALPRIEESVESAEKRSLMERWIASEMPERFDRFMNNALFKFFRKAKVWLLKMDNVVTERLKNIKPANEEATKPDFKDMMSSTEVAKPDESSDNTKES